MRGVFGAEAQAAQTEATSNKAKASAPAFRERIQQSNRDANRATGYDTDDEARASPADGPSLFVGIYDEIEDGSRTYQGTPTVSPEVDEAVPDAAAPPSPRVTPRATATDQSTNSFRELMQARLRQRSTPKMSERLAPADDEREATRVVGAEPDAHAVVKTVEPMDEGVDDAPE